MPSLFQTSPPPLDEKSSYYDQLNCVLDPFFSEVDRIIFRHVLFNLFFVTLCAAEIVLLFLFFTILAQSLILAFGLAVVFFTFFAYFTLRIYFQTKKPEQLRSIKNRYVEACKNLLQRQNDEKKEEELYTALANAYCKFANKLHAREYNYYRPLSWLSFLTPWTERLSCWLHWADIHLLKEQLLKEAVKEHVKLVKAQPISLQAHASLANAYVMLSGLYIDPRKMEGYDDERWIPANKYNDTFDDKFKETAENAIEEFKILEEFAPDDPWVHSQLAYSYHDMQMPLEEILEYETIQRLLPNDKDNLYKLGTLYFQQGMNAKGLRVYEELKKHHYERIDSLIKNYGCHKNRPFE